MNTSEKFCLKWNDFQQNIRSTFGSLREDTDFTDVTLACEDGHQVEAHKVILAASSPLFHNLLKRNKHTHPLIYMRGIKSEDLGAMLEFLYHGEASIYQENLDTFLSMAEELKLKGLTGGTEEILQKEDPKKSPENIPIIKKETMFNQNLPKPIVKTLIQTEKKYKYPIENVEQSVALILDYKVTAEVQDLDEKIKSLMSSTDELISGHRTQICNVCGKKGNMRNIKDHIEANHIEGISHSCNYCEKTFRSRNSLRVHKSSQHKI